ncbi:MAG: HAD family phosphatase [Deltaproteobacteria bacterium]|nr:HAD family phosphatase [Deltaproteobacteria bacterium]
MQIRRFVVKAGAHVLFACGDSSQSAGAMYRLVLFDLDATLLDSRRQICDANVSAIARLTQAGVRVGLATGRPPLSVAPYVERARPNAPLVHFNGAMVRDFESGAVLFERALARDVAASCLGIVRAQGFHANLYVGSQIWIEASTPTSQESERKDGVPHTVVGPLVDALASAPRAPTKILCIGPPTAVPALTQALGAAHGAQVALVNSEPSYLEILPPGCSKLVAAQHLAAHLGLALTEVMAFGDNLNDLELLTGCGLGVAMANSHPRVLAEVATHIGHHDSDAIARFLEGFVIEGGALRPVSS